MRRFRDYSHLVLILLIPLFLILFLVAERMVTQDYWVSYLPLDDYIPFCELFVIPYCLWYPALAATGLALLFTREIPAFRRYMVFLGAGLILSTLFCMVFPNGQDLRPETFPRENLLTRVVAGLYRADTNTNVLPSMHVVGAAAVVLGAFDAKRLKRRALRVGSIVLFVLISASCVLIKQHSILDVFAGLLLSVLLYVPVYGIWKRRTEPRTPG